MNRAIDRLRVVLLACFVILIARQFWLQAIVDRTIADNPHNPRSAIGNLDRAPIEARDGTLLAYTTNGVRRYPLGAALAQTVGYASNRFGDSGLEAAFADRLRVKPAVQSPLAQLRAIFVPSPVRKAAAPLVTTIDPGIEATLYRSLAPYARAAGIVLDPATGQVLAIASVPSFDPESLASEFARLHDDPASPFLNRALNGLYPPGSTFKIFTAAAALSAGVVTPASTFDDPGYLRVGNAVVHDNESERTGHQDLAGAFALSSNVDFARIALELGADNWFAAAGRWGLARPIPFPLPVAADHLPRRAAVTPSILAQLGFGQADLLLTPLRVALLAATIADDGRTPAPTIVDNQLSEQSLAKPISPATAGEVRRLMEAVVARGTGTAAALPAVAVAGKTGTATNPSGRAHAWFVAFAPADRARVVVAVVVEHGGYGGAVAAPIVRHVLGYALEHGTGGRGH